MFTLNAFLSKIGIVMPRLTSLYILYYQVFLVLVLQMLRSDGQGMTISP